MHVIHSIDPVYNKQSKILVLGSFPSVKSREGEFFYHHPYNRFWKVLAAIYNVPIPKSMEDKKQFLLQNNIALFDVVASCTITGSSDSSIRNVVVNDFNEILDSSNIQYIYTNGATATKLYKKYVEEKTHIKAIALPSTSPANARYTLEDLVKAWKVIKET